MSETVEMWQDMKNDRKKRRAEFGVNCPQCVKLLPKANKSILCPGEMCKIHKYRDPRPDERN